MKFTETKFAKFLSGKGFYLVLAGCFVALGVAAYTAYDSMAPDTASSEESSYIEESTPPSSEVEAEPEEIPYEPEISSQEQSIDTSEPYPVANSFIYPLSGNIIKGFSSEELVFSNTMGDMRLHIGLDIAAAAGSEVVSCGNGVVKTVGKDDLLGVFIEIDHGNGRTARYCGLADALSVLEGDTVTTGSPIGIVAEVPSECMDESHLHLEFFENGKPIDPVSIMEKR